ncbi:hypothetical protein [Novosphingobium jiangmenense]|uniref:Uncharacterized protein n=1 Tax=Novosphingobium jiangmenense TaxID=2791981 RepID=A0ABS0HI18_9SPHN|nr:hypothetical protein [Novosphingobium jiangmenense]MBF9151908.1 hypothetical protein [Novosphingobium jiangmenense]
MDNRQADLFAQDDAERNKLSDAERQVIEKRLLETLERLEAAPVFCWKNPLDAVHEENRFERYSKMLGDTGTALWARFDREMDRLYATQEED